MEWHWGQHIGLRGTATWNKRYMSWQFTIHQGVLYLHSMPKGETKDLPLFMVPEAHHVATLNGCYRDVGHQGCNHTLSLLWEHFWWPGMTNMGGLVLVLPCRVLLHCEVLHHRTRVKVQDDVVSGYWSYDSIIDNSDSPSIVQQLSWELSFSCYAFISDSFLVLWCILCLMPGS